MQNIKKNYYVIENGVATMHDKDFATKGEAIKWCINERRLDLKVGAINNYYEIYNIKDVDRKCLYTTKDVIYKFMRDEYPQIYPPKERKANSLFSLTKRCDLCTKFTNLRGSNNLCDEHYQKIVGDTKKKEIINVPEIKIDIANAILQSIK